VSLHLLFKPLLPPARETVWRKFLDRLPEPRQITNTANNNETLRAEKPLDDEDIKELSLWQLNGREIKNAVKMVRAWCDHKDYGMTLDKMESGIKVTNPHATKDGDVDKDLYD
jgi:hypothetical protein